MAELDDLIAEYDQKDADRVWILKQVEDFEDTRVFSFFARVLQDNNAEEEEKIEILNILRLKRITDQTIQNRLADIILDQLARTDEDLVAKFAAMSLTNFIVSPGVVATLERVVGDMQQDEDNRYNSLESLLDNSDRVDCKAAEG